MGCEPDQVLEALTGAVHDRADLESFGFSQRVAQLETVGRRCFAREQVIGNGAESENVEVLAQDVLVGRGFRGHVGRRGILDQPVHVRCRGNRLGDLGR
jgi:hypothetical protein